ncbi:MAG: glycoside hydrolase family 2 protein [Lachnospiraceae bacterium]|nr:glycoside hydrolase family 2 protein [Lachnospiraceae bacterium]
MRQVINFNAKWAFSKEATAVPTEVSSKWNFVNLPHCWNAIDGQDGGNDYYRGTAYYAKALDKMDLPTADRYYLELRGANSSADVYVNGKHLAHHDGGYSTWRVDITDALERDNLFVVEVDNAANDKVYPQVADFTFYGGLYRDVNIIAVSESHFDLEYYGGPGIQVTPVMNGANADVEVEVYVTNRKDDQTFVYTVKDAEGNVVANVTSDDNVANITIENAHLWHGRKDPYLYTVEVLLVEGTEVLDNVSTRFGCRSFEIHPDNGFILNGEEYPLRGVSRHQDRWGLGNALLPEHHEEDIDFILEVGCTTIRLAHYQHDQYFYDLCDEKGLVIWAEIPYISQHMPTARENTISQMKELIVQNYNHPSIVVWGLSNEITMKGDSDPDLLENHNILNDLCHEMDATRLTTIAAVSPCPIDSPYIQIPDVVSYNHYFGWYGGDTSMNGPWFDKFHETHPNIPIGCSEYGCEALNWHTSKPVQGDYTEEYQAFYHEELIKQLFTRKYMWATHVWNMFDFGADARSEGGENGQNHKGLMTFDRKYKKDSFYAYKAWLSDEPFVHLCGKRYVDRVEDVTKITVYSNQPEVELFVNGKSLGKKTSPEHFFYFDVPNEGESTLVAVAGELKDESKIRKVEEFNEAYRLKEKNAILNWFDITEPEGYFSLNDKIGDIMKNPQGAALFGGLLSQLMPKGEDGKPAKVAGGFEMNDGMMSMMGGFTVLRLSGMIGTMGINLTKEDLLGLNAKLNQIPKA